MNDDASATRSRSESQRVMVNTDAHALDAIAEMLRDPDWGVGMLEDIAQIVTRTGRSVETRHDGDGDPIDTWDRH